MNKVVADFNTIKNSKTLHQFLEKYSLDTKENSELFILHTHQGVLEDLNILVTHSWKDRCKSYDIRPDRNDIELKISDASGSVIHTSSVSYFDDY